MKIAYACLVLTWLWVITKFGVEWSKCHRHEERRLQEAQFLVETLCDHDVKNLAHEFAKCEEARVTIAGGSHGVWMRAFQNTFTAVALQTIKDSGALSITTISNVLTIVVALAILGTTCNAVTKWLQTTDENNFDVLSPLALSRLQNSVDLGPISYIDMKKNI